MVDARRLLKFLPHRKTLALLRLRLPVRLAGKRVLLPVSTDGGLQNLWWRPTWRTEVLRALYRPEMGEFIDVGANLGQTLLDLWVSHPRARYLGFEPNVACARFLQELIRANGFGDCRVVSSGLAAESGCRALFRHRDARSDPMASMVEDLRPGRDYEVDYVPCLRFDEVRESLRVERLGFVKVDVEGAELEVLRGMEQSLRRDRPPILCEVLFTDSKADLEASRQTNAEMMLLLQRLGYAVFQIEKTDATARVRAYRRQESFPNAFWSAANAELCDYLFMPRERESEITAGVRGDGASGSEHGELVAML